MSITGQEDEFRQLFAEEADQRLTDLTTQLLRLESEPADPDLVASLFREAHTLKGAAAVVGLDAISSVAHAMEDLLHELRAGDRVATPTLVDLLLVAVDGVRDMMAGALAGGDQSVEAAQLVSMLRSAEPAAAGAAGRGDAGAEPARDAAAVDGAPASGRAHEGGPAEPAEPGEPGEPGSAARGTGADHAGGPATGGRGADGGRGPDGETVRVPLTRLDQIVRLVGESAAAHLRVGRLLGERLGVDPGTVDEVRELSRVLNELQELTMRARMVPVVTITDVLQRAVRDVSRQTGKDVRWEVRGEDTELDRNVLQQLADPLLHIVRNAVDHGIEPADERVAAGKHPRGVVRFHAMQIGSEVILTVTDDGRGIDVERVRREAAVHNPAAADLSDEEALNLVFRSGVSTATFVSDISGRGVGLDVVRTNVDAVRGRIEIRNSPGEGSEFRVIVPITLAVLPCLLVEAGGRRHAIPMHSIAVAQGAAEAEQESSAGRPVVWHGNQALPLSSLAETIGLPADESGPIVVVSGLTRRHAFRVAALVGQRDVVVKGLSRLLPRLDVFAGASVEPDGSILLVLDAPGLIDQARRRRPMAPTTSDLSPAAPAPPTGGPGRARVLVVDDAMTVRELQRSILERAGYRVVTANDGLDALARLAEEPVDLVLTDVEMPRMDGFSLTEAIRRQPQRANVPVLMLTSRASEDDRQRGLVAGADGYIVKSAFDEAGLLQAVERLLGTGS
jgi:two-component system chemotaxis sensor kinase CheA